MHRSLLMIVIVGSLAVCFSSVAFADMAPICSFGGGNNHHDAYEQSCHYNPYNLTKDQCIDYCKNTEFCKMYQDEDKTVFGGFWRDALNSTACERECRQQSLQCDPNDQECLKRFIPDEIDCAQLTDESDQQWCEINCLNNILNSECGRSCLRDGIENGIEFEHLDGCQTNDYCSNLCTDYYCASIPLQYETKWSVFGAMLTLLTVLCGVILFVINRRRKPEDKGVRD